MSKLEPKEKSKHLNTSLSTITVIVNMSSTISTRLDKKEISEIETFAKQEDLDKSTFVKKLLHKSLEEYKVERAFKLYREGKVSLSKASALAEKSLWEMLELMKKYDVYLNFDMEEFERDLRNI